MLDLTRDDLTVHVVANYHGHLLAEVTWQRPPVVRPVYDAQANHMANEDGTPKYVLVDGPLPPRNRDGTYAGTGDYIRRRVWLSPERVIVGGATEVNGRLLDSIVAGRPGPWVGASITIPGDVVNPMEGHTFNGTWKVAPTIEIPTTWPGQSRAVPVKLVVQNPA